jgi:hypothetical protein
MSIKNTIRASGVNCGSLRKSGGATRRPSCSVGAAASMHLACDLARRLRASVVVPGLSARA